MPKRQEIACETMNFITVAYYVFIFTIDYEIFIVKNFH